MHRISEALTAEIAALPFCVRFNPSAAVPATATSTTAVFQQRAQKLTAAAATTAHIRTLHQGSHR
ncbi:hypothetical protein ABT040_37845 [Streptomyces sp. NPDC002688]|uniref:hypothetical protein n=1 Tax=Streptomyces sp. NPDC002688 TaxID=3154423 RepID=UPI0033196F6C